MTVAEGENCGTLISFDESGFTGPDLLNESQPYFVYASHDLSPEEAAKFLEGLRADYGLQGQELKATRLKKRGDWNELSRRICEVSDQRSRVVTFDKRAALAGKFYEYFFEPVLAKNSLAFYEIDFHRYMMNTILSLMWSSGADYSVLAKQMQKFMRTFDPADAEKIFGGAGSHPIEIERILKFCSGYSSTIETETEHLRAENDETGKWALDLTSSSLFSLLFQWWGHRHPRLRVLCDDSKPLAPVADYFDAWVGNNQSVEVTNGRSSSQLRGNLVAPLEFGSSDRHPTIQLADLLAGMTADFCIRRDGAPSGLQLWVRRNRMWSHSVEFDPELVRKGNPKVRVAREVLKELASRARRGADPIDQIGPYIESTQRRFCS
ncbi:DUF3800 domain-containing protein [Sulfitobacter sp. KE34]|nr:DUF3800 domain-containing protein [Sulfitobacter sp. KE27]MDF3357795.1 DUF3800 domain-containing protein [Sulfitobacter sp. KE33]MDF3360052.1 DUF3800 domain-containing protein [Sulfitobacter sp. Ks41]MDF3365394.1 DUF3800 domain-containing protein [Sulfitobacter sp. Ks34]MDF3369002.1 DUF3800 domain-containing protein [Sulfitobacter sp. Ks43]MDF3372477.1 DUF3800 domain-containing protein [Sulfitobacter sp. KS8]MDF3376114.1 DUF3800 domain-containing protein [Sulfitobacter sp. KE37]MDF3379955